MGIHPVALPRTGQSAVVECRTAGHGPRGLGTDHPFGADSSNTPIPEIYTGDAYCVKCKEKREFTGEVHETNGRRMAKGICPVCGTKMNRILGKA